MTHLTILSIAEPKAGSDGRGGIRFFLTYRCACSCGRETVVRQMDFHSGNTRSCGHLQKQAARIVLQTAANPAKPKFSRLELLERQRTQKRLWWRNNHAANN
jgi:hypothetical protein